MANAVYVALITAIYAAIFIVSSEFVMSYENLLSDSGWASFIISQNMKFVGIGMIGVAIIVDTLSALRRKRYDEYQIVLLEKVFLFNGLFTAGVGVRYWFRFRWLCLYSHRCILSKPFLR